MYNKYLTMKRSELKEAIKAEIKSVLSENTGQERYDALNDNDQDVAILNNMTKKYGKDVVLYWLTSGNYGSLDESVLSENESKSAVHSLGKDLYDHMTSTFKMEGGLSSPIKADTINKGQQFTVLINDNGGKLDTVKLYIPVGKDNIKKEYIQKNIVDQVKRKYKELETKITQIDSTGNNKAMVDFTLTGPNLFQKVTEQSDNPNFDKKVASFAKKINNEMDYPGGVLEAMKQIKSRLERIISKVEDAKRGGAEEEPLMKMIGLKEVYQTNSKMSQIVSLFQDMMDDEYDGMDYRKALNDVLKAIDDDYKSAEREGEKFSRIREDDEPTAADLKKKDSVATTSNKLQKLTAKMKKKAKEFKEAEGKAKDKIKDELKDMTAEKKKLEKDL